MTTRHAIAMPVAPLMFHASPWLTDQAWIAHESLPVFAPIAASYPNGRWHCCAHPGDDLSDFPAPDLPGMIGLLADRSTPCVLDLDHVHPAPSIPAAIAEIPAGPQVVQVLAEDGTLWSFNGAFLIGATVGITRESWRISPLDATQRALVMFDPDGAPLFAVASFHLEHT
jgi:hypothetical protein